MTTLPFNDKKPIEQKLDELAEFLFDMSMSSCDRPESKDSFFKAVSFEIFSPNAIIIEGLGNYAHGFPIPDGYGYSAFFPYKQPLWDKEYAVCTTETYEGHCDTLIVATNSDELLKAKEVYDERMRLKWEEDNREMMKALESKETECEAQNSHKHKG